MTLRTRSLLGHRLFERLASRLGGTRRGSGSTLFERLGLEDPWANRYGASPGLQLVYLTLPPDEDDEELADAEQETARELMARVGRRVRRQTRQKRKSSRRRMIDRITASDKERPGVRSRLTRARGLDVRQRPTHGTMYESDFIYTEPEPTAVVAEEEEEERIIRWGASPTRPPRTTGRKRSAAPAPPVRLQSTRRLQVAPPRSERAAARVQRPDRAAVPQRSIRRPAVRRPSAVERPSSRQGAAHCG